MYEFTYQCPTTLDDAIAALKAADDGKLMAGGQTLLPTLKQRLAQPSDVIDLARIDALNGIRVDAGQVTVGAMTNHAAVEYSDEVRRAIPALSHLAECIGDPQVRNRGTIGGSIANADPAADYPAAVVGLDATVTTDQREIAADDFFTELFETALAEDEVITAVGFPVPKRAAYMKFPNPASRYAIVGVMVAETSRGIRVAVTGAGPTVFRIEPMEQALDANFSPEAVENITIDDSELNSDIHASAEYRAHLVTVMAKRAVAAMLG